MLVYQEEFQFADVAQFVADHAVSCGFTVKMSNVGVFTVLSVYN